MAPQILTDADIDRLVAEAKVLPEDYPAKLRLKPKRGHSERELDVSGADGSEFRIILRQNRFNPLDFSVILAYRVPGTNRMFRLRRYNGRHEHTNRLERETCDACHVHQATQRYQDSGLREDAYARATDRFADLHGALDCLLHDCGFEAPAANQLSLFPEGDSP